MLWQPRGCQHPPGHELSTVSINTLVGSTVYGSSLGQLRVINNAASTPASLSLFGYGNTNTGTTFAKIEFAQQENGPNGQVTAEIKALAVGTDERGTDLTFTTRPNTSSSSAVERLRIDSSGSISYRTGGGKGFTFNVRGATSKHPFTRLSSLV